MTRINLCLYTLIAILLCGTTTFSQNALSPVALKVQQAKQLNFDFKTVQIFDQAGDLEALPEAQSALKAATLLDLKLADLKAVFDAKAETIELALPTSQDQDLTLELVRYETLAEGFQVTTASTGGTAVPYTPGVFYRGIVKGQNNSIAAISFFDNEVIGVISTMQDGEMVLGKTTKSQDQYILFKEKDLLVTNDFECGTDELDVSKIDLKKLQDIANAGTESVANCVKVYIECEHDMYLEKGSVTNTVNYMAGLFNVVATLYQNETITTQTSEIFVWDTPDSYPTSSSSNALNDFRATRPSFNGDLAHLVSRGAPTGGGVAWVDALCTSYAYAYSYVNSTYSAFPTYSWSVEVFTHEMGHNLGSPHTHACAWNGNNTAIDGCGPAAGYSEGCNASVPAEGTIMSYCHLVSGIGINFNLGFGQQPGDLIRNEITNASCLTTCGPPCSLSVSVTGTNANGGNNGTATATPSGGTTPYAYAWSNGGSTSTITGLAPGTYTATVTDNTGCTATGSYTVEDVTPCSGNDLTLTLVLDNYPEETSWEVRDASNAVVASSNGTYAAYGDGATVIEDLCIPNGCYDFIIYDSYGDGICCGYGNGSYSLEDASSTVLASGGQFGSSETTNFCLGGGGPTQYTLTTSVNGSGSVTPSGGTFNDGTVVSMTATAAAGWQFDNWSGDLSGSANPANITMDANKAVTANFSQVGGGGCTYSTINDQDFEGGWGIWNDGGSDARRSSNDQTYANSGVYCVRLRDNTSTSVMTTDNLDLSSYDELTVDFTYIARSMDNSNEDFWLQISTNGGATFTTVEEWNQGDEFVNNVREFDGVVIPGPFTTTTQLRFRCDASGNSDWIYIDDVLITGCAPAAQNPLVGNPSNNEPTTDTPNAIQAITQNAENTNELAVTSMRLFPNPVATELTVAYKTGTDQPVQLILMDFTGRIIRQMKTPSGQHYERIDVRDLNAGYYMVQMIVGEEKLVQKFVVTK